MSLFNITAQIYDRHDQYKQTIFMNELVESSNEISAKDLFKSNLIERDDILVKILSVEQISQDVA